MPMAHGGWPPSNVTPVGDPSQELGAGQLQRLALPMLGLDMESDGGKTLVRMMSSLICNSPCPK